MEEVDGHGDRARPAPLATDNLRHIEEAARRRVEEQTSNLEALRSRASFFLAGTVGIATFFGGELLTRSDSLEGPALSALLAGTGSAFALLLVLWPKKWAGGMQTFKLLKYYVDRGAPAPHGAFLRDLSIFWERQFRRNRRVMERNNYYFIAGLLLLAEHLAFWIIEFRMRVF